MEKTIRDDPPTPPNLVLAPMIYIPLFFFSFS